MLLLTPLVALPFLAWSVPDLNTELSRIKKEAHRETTEIFNDTEHGIQEIHVRRAEDNTWRSVYQKGRRKVDRNRPVYNGEVANSMEYAAACVLLDGNRWPACTAAIVAPRWVITAGHCISGRVTYVKYNTRHPTSDEGNVSTVLRLYRHPYYQIEYKDEGLGMSVALLRHDVGLVQVQDVMEPRAKLRADPLITMRWYSPADMNRKDLQIIGFGRRDDQFEQRPRELVTTKLQMRYCNRTKWVHCICGVTRVDLLRDTGICSGDSGGPVLYRGVQVAVTSMGPSDCEKPNTTVRAIPVSVFTYLYHYADMINATIRDAQDSPRLVQVQYATAHSDQSHLSRSVFGLAVLFLICNS